MSEDHICGNGELPCKECVYYAYPLVKEPCRSCCHSYVCNFTKKEDEEDT